LKIKLHLETKILKGKEINLTKMEVAIIQQYPMEIMLMEEDKGL
jgi:hypothetical protein